MKGANGPPSAKRWAMRPNCERTPNAPLNRRHLMQRKARKNTYRSLRPIGQEDLSTWPDFQVTPVVGVRVAQLKHECELSFAGSGTMTNVRMPGKMAPFGGIITGNLRAFRKFAHIEIKLVLVGMPDKLNQPGHHPTQVSDIVHPNEFRMTQIMIPIAAHKQRVIGGDVGNFRNNVITFPLGKRIGH